MRRRPISSRKLRVAALQYHRYHHPYRRDKRTPRPCRYTSHTGMCWHRRLHPFRARPSPRQRRQPLRRRRSPLRPRLPRHRQPSLQRPFRQTHPSHSPRCRPPPSSHPSLPSHLARARRRHQHRPRSRHPFPRDPIHPTHHPRSGRRHRRSPLRPMVRRAGLSSSNPAPRRTRAQTRSPAPVRLGRWSCCSAVLVFPSA
jgi:hypothetical protein